MLTTPFERIDSVRLDVAKLQDNFATVVQPLPPVWFTKMIAGWSIQSYTGSYRDGWQSGQHFMETIDGKLVFNHARAEAAGYHSNTMDFKNPTECHVGYMNEVMQQLADLGLTPRRARWGLITAHGQTTLHRDALDEDYGMRVHIPVITNDNAIFSTEGMTQHIPADGAIYMTRVNRLHQVFNHGDQDRVHIVMNAWDRKGISQYHRFARDN